MAGVVARRFVVMPCRVRRNNDGIVPPPSLFLCPSLPTDGSALGSGVLMTGLDDIAEGPAANDDTTPLTVSLSSLARRGAAMKSPREMKEGKKGYLRAVFQIKAILAWVGGHPPAR